LDEVILLVVEGGAAELRDGEGVVQRRAIVSGADEGVVAGRLDALGDPVHGPLEGPFLPMIGVGRAVLHGPEAVRRVHPTDRRGALWAEGALVDRAARITLDVDDPIALGVDALRAADGAVRADARPDAVRISEARTEGAGSLGPRGDAERVCASELPEDRP